MNGSGNGLGGSSEVRKLAERVTIIAQRVAKLELGLAGASVRVPGPCPFVSCGSPDTTFEDMPFQMVRCVCLVCSAKGPKANNRLLASEAWSDR